MINNTLFTEFKSYQARNINEVKNALKEILQKIILSGLSRSGFFNYFVFYGGTSVRLIYQLDRFSEDLDFVINASDVDINNLDMNFYMTSIDNELKFFSINSVSQIKNKTKETSTISGYVKANLYSLLELIGLENQYKVSKDENISIKLDIETKFTFGGNIVSKHLTFPILYTVETYDLPSLFSSKLIAIFTRNWKTRVKGRDYYDFIFYVSKKVKPNYVLLENGLSLANLNVDLLRELLKSKFNEVDFNSALNDVSCFVSDTNLIKNSFNLETFLDLVNDIE